MIFLKLAVALLTLLAAGAGPAVELRRRSWRGGWTSLAGLAFVFGFGLVGLASIVLMLAGLRTSALVPPVIAAASVAWAVARFRPPAPPDERTAWRFLLAIPALAAVALACVDDNPGWDVRSFWGLKAKSIQRHGTFRNPDFTESERPHPHARYPLLGPSVHAWIQAATGSHDGRAIRLTMACFFAASLAVVLAALRERVPERWALALTAVFSTTPAVLTAESGGAASGYFDYPLSIFFLIACVELRGWIEEGDRRAAWAAAFAIACLGQVKDEGVAMSATLLLAGAPLAFRTGGGRRAALSLAIPAAGLLLAAAWLWTRRDLLPDEANFAASRGIRLSWIPEILRQLASQTLRPKEWTLLWAGVYALLILRRPRLIESETLLPLAGALILGIYVLVWAGFPAASPKDIMRHGANRLVLHVLPVFYVWGAGRLSAWVK